MDRYSAVKNLNYIIEVGRDSGGYLLYWYYRVSDGSYCCTGKTHTYWDALNKANELVRQLHLRKLVNAQLIHNIGDK